MILPITIVSGYLYDVKPISSPRVPLSFQSYTKSKGDQTCIIAENKDGSKIILCHSSTIPDIPEGWMISEVNLPENWGFSDVANHKRLTILSKSGNFYILASLDF